MKLNKLGGGKDLQEEGYCDRFQNQIVFPAATRRFADLQLRDESGVRHNKAAAEFRRRLVKSGGYVTRPATRFPNPAP